MSSWWKKFRDTFQPRTIDPVDGSVVAPPEPEPPAETPLVEPDGATTNLSQAPSSHEASPVATSPAESRTDSAAKLAWLSGETAGLAKALGCLDGKTQEILETVQRLQHFAAGLPELSTDAAKSLGDIEDRLDLLERRTAEAADGLRHVAGETTGMKESVGGLERSQDECRRACIQFAQRQDQMADTLPGLQELTTRSVELAKASAVAVKEVAGERSEQIEDLRRHVTEECRHVAVRATIASLLAALAAVAAATAAVISALHQP